MARSDAVWGIDIGQCALKALRCRPGPDPSQVLAEAFDYVEYPKILSQPESDPVALVQEAITQFLSRNSVRGDKVAVSVPGQSGLARFIKLPPVESKKIPDIVKYEARQQIPFALEDVVWDYQKMVGGSEEEGFALETEVGLFAMKRDQVYRALKPFIDAGIEVDIVQLTPLALYNFVVFDQMQDLPPPSEYDPDSPPPSTVLLSLGTDSTDLVVTNGFRVWQRSVPIGGNHFTKALTKELKLTFATAEHLKRNAAKADDPKALFQAMRPVFNDLLTEVQRSIGYFSNLDRRAKIGRVLGLGNAMKLPGLQRYLAQNLGNDFSRLEAFRGLTGPAVLDAPAFKENVASFGVCYGLALQGLKESAIRTNLLPREIMKDRMIRAKKPWAVGAAAALLLGCTISYFGYWRAWNAVLQDGYFAPAVARANEVVQRADGYESSFNSAKDAYKKTNDVGQSLVPSAERRERWLEVWKALNLALPTDEGELPADVTKRKSLNILSVQAQHLDDVTSWYAGVKEFYKAEPKAPPPAPPPPAEGAEGAEAAPPPAEPAPEEEVPGPTGPGWIIALRGYHYHNDKVHLETSKEHYVRQTIIRALHSGKLTIPEQDRVKDGPSEIDLKKLGLFFPVVVPANGAKTYEVFWENKLEGVDDGPKAEGEVAQAKLIPAPRFDFVVELCWLDEPPKDEPPPGEEGAVPTEAAEGTAPPAAAAPPPAADENAPAEGAPAAETPTPPAGEAPPAEAPAETPAAPAGETPPATGEAPAADDAPAAQPPAAAPAAGEPPATPPAAPPNP